MYGVRCSDSTLYVGITNNLKARIEKHNKGTGAKYTRSRRPVKLLCSEKCGDIGSAMRRERELKKFPKAKKELWSRGEKEQRKQRPATKALKHKKQNTKYKPQRALRKEKRLNIEKN